MFIVAFMCGIMFCSACAHTTTFLFVSAFHLSYNMLLNQMRSEDGDPEKLLRHSFYQFQADRSLPDLEVFAFL